MVRSGTEASRLVSLRAIKKNLLVVPLLGKAALAIWRLVKDPYLGPIGDRFAERLPRWSRQTIVQIGANDGVRFDPISSLLRNRYFWRVLFVEPIPHVFKQLVHNFGNSSRYMFECAAVSNSQGEFKFYYLSSEARFAAVRWHEYFDLIGSLDRSHLVKALADEAGNLERFIVETQVPAITLQTLLAKWSIRRIDALVVDAEGYDWKIVSQALDLGLRPEIIMFEHSNLLPSEREAAIKSLKDDYRIDDVGIDFICMRKRREFQE